MYTNPLIWFADLCIFAGLWLMGILIVRALFPNSHFIEQIPLGYGLGIGIFTWVLFILSWVGIPLNSLTLLSVFFLIVTISIIGPRIAGRRSIMTPEPLPNRMSGIEGPSDIIGWILFAAFSLTLLFISTGLSYYYWDAMAIWSVKGYGIGLEHSIFGAVTWGAKGIAYPLNIPLAISVFFTADRDLLPGSKFLFPGFYIAMLMGLRVLFCKQKLTAWFAWCAVFAVGTIPLFLQYSLIGYANIPFAYYFVIGIIWIGLGLAEKVPQRILLGSLLLTLSVWTRLEGIEFWPIAILGLAFIWKRDLFTRRSVLRILPPVLAVGGSWILFGWLNHASTGETTLLSDGLARMLHGQLHPTAVYQILRFTAYLVFKTRVFGILIPVAIGLALLATIFSTEVRKEKLSMTLLVSGIFTGLGVIFMYYLTSYDPSLDLLSWLGTGYDRMLSATVILLATGSVLVLYQILAHSRGKN